MNSEVVSSVPQGVTDIFLSNGLIGAVCLILMLTVGWLFRLREKDREKYETTIEKLNEARIAEMKTGMAQLNDAIDTLDKVMMTKGAST